MLLNLFRPGRMALLGLHAGAILVTHVVAGALLGGLTVAALSTRRRMVQAPRE